MSARFLRRHPEHTVLAAAMLMLTAQGAQACAVRLGPVTTTALNYDPFELGSGEIWVRTTLELTDGTECTVHVGLRDDADTPLRTVRLGGVDGIEFRVETPQINGAATGFVADMATVRLDSGRPSVPVAWRLMIARDAVIPPGEYVFPFMVRASADTATEQESARGTIALRSMARAQANFAGVAGSFQSGSSNQTIDLGELTTGEQRSAFLQLRANTPAHVHFDSRNAGFLVNESAPASRIAYRLAMDGDEVDLRAPTEKMVTAPLTINGFALELRVTVGSVEGKSAGRYSDTVAIDVSP